jgi:hypothetical protein
MNEPSQLDMAQLKFEMRQLYSHIGFEGSLQVLYEMLLGARIMAEVIMEEKAEHEII